MLFDFSSFNLNDTKYTKGAKAPHEATNLHPVHSSRRINAGFASKQWASVHQSPQWVENSRSTLGNFRFRFYPLIFMDLDPKRLSLHRTSLQGTSRTFRHLRPRLPWASEIDLLKVHHSPVSVLYFTFLCDSKMIFKPQVLVIHAPWQSSLKISQAFRVQGSPMSHVQFQTQMGVSENSVPGTRKPNG